MAAKTSFAQKLGLDYHPWLPPCYEYTHSHRGQGILVLMMGRGNRPARLHKRADTRLLGLINEMQPAEMPSRGAVACRRKDYIDAHLGG